MKAILRLSVVLCLASGQVFADDAACQTIRDAYSKTGTRGARMKTSGYNFAHDTPALYGFGKHICNRLREEIVGGQPATVYQERYEGERGSTTATIWISRLSGRLLKEEQDGDIRGKGKGHIAYSWPAKP